MSNSGCKIIHKYSETFKQVVVNSVENKELGITEASRYYKVPERNIYRWREKYGRGMSKSGVVSVEVNNALDKIRKLERLVSELSLKNRVLIEETKICKEMIAKDNKKKFSMKQLERLEELKQELAELNE